MGVGGDLKTNSFPSGSAITDRVAVNPGGLIVWGGSTTRPPRREISSQADFGS